jgi:tRNA-5-taurinomethyluridine 2-sulfurtransferase
LYRNQEYTLKIAVLVSGGVDSSLAFYLKIWLEDELAYLGDCPWEEDLSYVRAVCEQLQVPLEVVNFQAEYWAHVVSYALREIQAGRTPNPDIMCNKEIKFGAFLERYGNQFDKVATGHYAQTITKEGKVFLRLAPDPIKDQTYFLARLSQAQLQKVLFPIGHLTKAQVRQHAVEYDLPNKDRKDSQGICFLGTIKFSDFLHHHFGNRVGPLVEYETGNAVGTHNGFYYFTVGQRQGIGLSGGPWYVVSKNSQTNTVFISRTYFAQDKERRTFEIEDVLGDLPSHCAVKLRHGPALAECSVSPMPSGALITLAANDQGIAPGQFAVFYDADICVGSGRIKGVV